MRKFFSLIAAVLFAGSMMATVTILPSDFTPAESSDYAVVKEGVTVGVTASTVNAEQMRIFKNQTMRIASSSAITKIVFTCTANGTDKYGPGCFAAQEGYTFEADGPTGTWDGNSNGVSFTAETNQVRITEIVVYLDGEEEPALGAWNEIVFTAATAKADLPEDSVFKSDKEGFEAKIADSGDKMVIDANVARFGTAAGYDKYDFRLKSGGASGSDKNFLTISVPTDGYLGVAARTGTNTDTTRVLYLIQDGDTLFNDVIRESQAIEVMEDTTTVKVYPYVTVPVKAGSVIVRYNAALNFYAFGFNGTVAPVAEPDTIPTVAPAAPKQAEKDVMAIYSSYYKQNNYNFNVLGWGGIATWQTLKLGADSVNVLACQDMKWEIMTNWDTNHYDMSAYETLHADLWAPADAKVKISFEALGTADGGSGYKNGVSVDIQKGWNSVDVPLNTWPENYNFADIRYLIFEGYQTPAGESFENNPFAFANVYFWKTPELIDPTNCAEAAEAALSVSENNELYKDSAVYTIPGYVTEIAFAYDSTKNNMSFWMADEKNGGKVLEAYKCVIMKADDAVRVGDLVKVTGCLTKYNKTPEFAAGCTVEIVERDTTPAVEPKNLGEKTIAEFLELKNKIDTCILTGIIDSVVNTQYGNFNIVDATGKVYVYGLLNAAGETKKCYEEENLAEGDTLTIKAIYAEYNNNPQVKNAIFVAVKHQPVTPIEPLTIPETAPAAPTADVNDVLAIYCNYYKENNLNFGISGWAGGYQTLSIDSTNIGYWTKMTWECIIDPLATDSAHNLGGYKKLHVDLWAPLPAKIKFTVEAVAGGNYKDGVVANLEQGWNSCDFVVAEWPGEYDFTNVKCFVFEQYQTPKGESFEQNPFAFANIYFYDKEAQGIDNTADGVKAQKFIQNGMLLIEKNGRVYTITGQAVR